MGVLLTVLLLVVATLGATGLSDKMLGAIANEELRGIRQGLAQTIRDPGEIERVIQERREQLTEEYGLDQPWFFRLPGLLWRVLSLDLGSARTLKSFGGSARVSDIVLERVPNTLILVTSALAITAILGLALGVKLATRVGTRTDRSVSYVAAISNALPSWWVGILLLLVLSFQFGLFPSGGLYSTPPPVTDLGRIVDLLWHAALPILTLVLVTIGGWTFSVRSMVLNIAHEDFVTVARAKGLPEGLVMRRHIIRAAAPPIVTTLILSLANSVGGAILIESVFNWPGMGRLYFDAIMALDEAVIIALTFLFTLIYVVARFILEILYLYLDPRVQY